MKPEELNEPIDIYTASKTIDANGENKTTYTLLSKAFAKVERKQNETETNDTIILDEVLKLTTHYQTSINTKMRIVYENENYNIINIQKIENNRYLELIAIKEEI